ncbi:hypothetical protein [Frondihabitans sp. 762G35]|uniref:hypothetical protein n=1 Tax=Frondihabitans sp. 762G35 TaxID=1446794 RepID=UPI000E70641A|nr:hypothetical protein [Frondihabitans sp. 762G35]
MSIGWLWSARVLVAVVAAMILLCRLTGASIDDLTADGGGPFLSQFALAISLIFGILSPTILLPFSYAGTTRKIGSVITGQTVFGPRRMDIRTSRCFTWSLPGLSGVSEFVSLIGRSSGLLIVSSTGDITGASDLAQGVDRGAASDNSRTSPPREFVRTLASSAIHAILFFSFACVVTVATAGAALGG